MPVERDVFGQVDLLARPVVALGVQVGRHRDDCRGFDDLIGDLIQLMIRFD